MGIMVGEMHIDWKPRSHTDWITIVKENTVENTFDKLELYDLINSLQEEGHSANPGTSLRGGFKAGDKVYLSLDKIQHGEHDKQITIPRYARGVALRNDPCKRNEDSIFVRFTFNGISVVSSVIVDDEEPDISKVNSDKE